MADDDAWRDQRRRGLGGDTASTPPLQSVPTPSGRLGYRGNRIRPPAASGTSLVRVAQRTTSFWLWSVAGAMLVAVVGVWLWYDRAEAPASAAVQSAGAARPDTAGSQPSCVTPEVLSRLRSLLFDRALQVGGPNPRLLEARASTSVLGVENAQVRTLDASDTICAGRLSLQLADGSLLSAAVQYSAGPASGVLGRAATLTGADEIVRRLVELEPDDDTAPPALRAPVPVVHKGQGPRAPISDLHSAPIIPGKTASTRKHAKTVPTAKAQSTRPRSRTALLRSNRSLMALDNTVNLLAAPSGRAGLDRRAALGQTAFIARRDRCTSADCIVGTYRARIDELARLRAGR